MTQTRSHSPPPGPPPPARPGHGRHRARLDRAASLVEYVMMIALIAFVCITAISFFGSENAGSVTTSADSIVNAG